MTPSIFATWLRRQGYPVARTASSYWCLQGPRTLQAFPYHWLVAPQSGEVEELLKHARCVGARYSTPLTAAQGIASYHVVLDRGDYTLDRLPKKARHDVRKAALVGGVEPLTFAYLADEGWKLRCETLQRQNRTGAESSRWWQVLCRSAADLAGFEAWGVRVDGQLSAALLAFTCDNCCCILYQQSRTAYLSQGVNNLLTFAFTETVIQRPGIESIFYGLHSLDAPASVDEFKFRMGYCAKPVRQRVVFHPLAAPLFNRASHAVVKQLARWRPDNPMLAKTEGMMRFYLEGKRPLAQQAWPVPLPKTNANEQVTVSGD